MKKILLSVAVSAVVLTAFARGAPPLARVELYVPADWGTTTCALVNSEQNVFIQTEGNPGGSICIAGYYTKPGTYTFYAYDNEGHGTNSATLNSQRVTSFTLPIPNDFYVNVLLSE